MADIFAILNATTTQLRKGPEVVQRTSPALSVTEIYDMPAVAEALPELVKVDMEFMVIGVDPVKAEEHRAGLIEWLDNLGPDEATAFAGGPSYITAGAIIGDQGAAFQLYALGQVLGLWKVITPATFGFTGQEAREMAGNGLIMMTGYKKAEVPA
jgi:hypothetical protein